VILGESVFDADSQLAVGTLDGGEVSLLAVPGHTPVHSAPLGQCRIRSAVVVNVAPHPHIRRLPRGNGHRHIAQWTHRHLDVFPVGSLASVSLVLHVVLAVEIGTGVALYREEV